MNYSKQVVDIDRVLEWCERRGVTLRDLSALTGVRECTLRRYQTGYKRGRSRTRLIPQISTIIKILVCLGGLPADAIIPGLPGTWLKASYAAPETVFPLMHDIARASEIVTLHKSLDAYLIPDIAWDGLRKRQVESKVNLWTPEQWRIHDSHNWLAHEQECYRLRIARHHESDLSPLQPFMHWVVVGADFFARHYEREWLAETSRLVERYQDTLALGILPPAAFSSLCAEIDGMVREVYRCPFILDLRNDTWRKIHVIDDNCLIIRSPFFVWYYTYHRPTVRRWKGKILHGARDLVPYTFPMPGEQRQPKNVLHRTYNAREVLMTLARSKAQAH